MFPADIVHRAARLFFAVSCAVAVGWTAARLIGTDHPDAFRQAKSATAGPPASCDSLMSRRSDCLTWLMLRASWSFVHDEYASEPLLGASPAAGITCAVLQAPVIGHLARAGVENFVGTMLGGWLGFAIFVLGHAIQASYGLESTMAQFTLRAGLAPFVGALGVVVGWLLGMDSSGRLVLLTYLLVNINNDDYEHALEYTVSRILGIVVGILSSHAAHMLVFPKAATRKSLSHFSHALHMLLELNAEQAWGPDHVVLQENRPGAPDGSRAILVPTTVSQRQIDERNYYGIINNALNDCEGLIGASRYEVFLGRWGACWCFLPACTPSCQPLPAPQLRQAAAAVRRLARLLYALHLLLEDGVLAPALKGSMHQADASLQQLAGLLHGALQDMATAFPQQAPIPSGNLHNFLKAVPSTVSQPGWALVNPLSAHQASRLDEGAPSTSQAQAVQVRWHAFQFLMEQLSGETAALFNALDSLIHELQLQLYLQPQQP